MTTDLLISDLAQQAFVTALLLSAPVLLAGAIVGLLVGILQTATQIHDQTLSFVPKLMAVLAALIVLLPWMLQRLSSYAAAMFSGWPVP